MRPLALALVLLTIPAVASAQICPAGLVAADSAHCCWPGQLFDGARGLCSGTPQCPQGLAPYGETCLAAQPQAAQPPAPAPAQSPELPPLPPPPPANYLPPASAGYQVLPPPVVPGMPQPFGHSRHFVAKNQGNEFTVTVDGAGMCRTPCALAVPAGKHVVKIEGDARFTQKVTFPEGASKVEIEKRRNGGIALGVVSLSVGVPTAIVGAAFGLSGLLSNYFSYGSYGAKDTMYAGFGAMAAGATVAAVGAAIGFRLAGHNRLSLTTELSAEEPKAPPVQLISMGAMPTKDGAMVGATFAF
ncbi:MAG: PEGA domain-containing protein [Myxococcales bacterium]